MYLILLHWAAFYGNLEVAKLCVNMDADLNKKSIFGKRTPFQEAKRTGNYDIAQLLLLSQSTGNIGERIKEKADELNREYGIIEAFIDELSQIGEQTAEIFKKTLIEIMTRLIQKKKIFADIMLSLCLKFIESEEKGRKFEESELFKDAIIKTSKNIIRATEKRDWFWMKEAVIPSTVSEIY